VEVCRGLGRSGNHWRREIEWAEFLTGGEVGGVAKRDAGVWWRRGGDGSPGGCAGGRYRAAGRIGVRAWVGRPANSSARIAGERCGRRKASLTGGPGRSAGEAGSACGPGARRRQAAGRAVRRGTGPKYAGARLVEVLRSGLGRAEPKRPGPAEERASGPAKRERERARLMGAGPRERVLDWAGLAGLSAGVVWAGFGFSIFLSLFYFFSFPLNSKLFEFK